MHPPAIEDPQFLRHAEGDLIKGAANASAANELRALTDKTLSVAQSLRLRLKYGQGREMPMQSKLSERTGMVVYFSDEHSQCQQGSKENTNGSREYLPQGTVLSI